VRHMFAALDLASGQMRYFTLDGSDYPASS
jgi:hypothetical protein